MLSVPVAEIHKKKVECPTWLVLVSVVPKGLLLILKCIREPEVTLGTQASKP